MNQASDQVQFGGCDIRTKVLKRDIREKESLCYTLFKPPKNDTSYFHYTEVWNEYPTTK